VNNSARLGLLGLTIALGACSVLEGDKIDYKSASKGSTLEVPPDLKTLSRDTRYTVPGGVVSANAMQANQAAQPSGPQTAVSSLGDVRIERNGNQRWLVVNRPADQLWDPVREFWLENGFTLALDQSNIGIMETDWAENRAKIPQDFIRNTLGRVLDSLYSTGERDKFRTRLERNAQGGTEIYVSHRGMQEVFNTSTKETTVWQPRAADPELEAEFLRRLLVKLGVSQEQAKAVAATPAARASSSRVGNVGPGSAGAPDPFLEMFARGSRHGWSTWGNQADEYFPDWPTYSNHSQSSPEAAASQSALFESANAF